jgi:hypothetical protein
MVYANHFHSFGASSGAAAVQNRGLAELDSARLQALALRDAHAGRQGRERRSMKIFAYIISSLIGFAIGHYLLQGAAAAFASILISYHLYLVFLVISAQHEKGISLPIRQTVLTHLAFLVVVAGLPFLREQIPFFYVVKWLIPGLAPFETQWLFGGKGPAVKTVLDEKPITVAEATAQDHQEFIVYLRQKHRPFRKAGMSIDDEFEAWFADRASKRAGVGPMAGTRSGPVQPLEQRRGASE